jgi:hypothetical protein
MKTSLAVFLVLVLGDQVTGKEIAVVSPNSYTDVEAPDIYGYILPVPDMFRMQTINSNTQFAAVPNGGATISEINLRPNEDIPVGTLVSAGRLQISLSITQVDPRRIEATFAENITGAPIVVYDGPWSATVLDVGPSGGPRAFESRIPLQQEFFYNPAQGNLLQDWRFENYNSTFHDGLWAQDFDALSSSEVSMIYSDELGADSPKSVLYIFTGSVTEFIFVPEPSVLVLVLVAGTSVLLRRDAIGMLN